MIFKASLNAVNNWKGGHSPPLPSSQGGRSHAWPLAHAWIQPTCACQFSLAVLAQQPGPLLPSPSPLSPLSSQCPEPQREDVGVALKEQSRLGDLPGRQAGPLLHRPETLAPLVLAGVGGQDTARAVGKKCPSLTSASCCPSCGTKSGERCSHCLARAMAGPRPPRMVGAARAVGPTRKRTRTPPRTCVEPPVLLTRTRVSNVIVVAAYNHTVN